MSLENYGTSECGAQRFRKEPFIRLGNKRTFESKASLPLHCGFLPTLNVCRGGYYRLDFSAMTR